MVLISYVPGMKMEEAEGKASSAWTSNPWWWASCQAASRTGTDSQKPLFPQWTHTGRVPAKPWPFLIAHLTTSIYTFNLECEEQSHAWAFLSADLFQKWLSGTHGCWLLIALWSLKIGFSAVEADRVMHLTLPVGSLTDCTSRPGAHLPGCTEIGGKRIDEIGGEVSPLKCEKKKKKK